MFFFALVNAFIATFDQIFLVLHQFSFTKFSNNKNFVKKNRYNNCHYQSCKFLNTCGMSHQGIESTSTEISFDSTLLYKGIFCYLQLAIRKTGIAQLCCAVQARKFMHSRIRAVLSVNPYEVLTSSFNFEHISRWPNTRSSILRFIVSLVCVKCSLIEF